MEDLIDWLREALAARERVLDEDEGLARMAFAEHNNAIAEWREPWSGTVEIGPDEDDLCCNDSGISRHIVNWDPKRVLDEVAAERVDIAALRRILDEFSWESGETRAVMLLAQRYARHEGFKPEWRVEV